MGTRLQHTVTSSPGSPDMGGLGTRLEHTVASSLGSPDTGGGGWDKGYSIQFPRLPGYGGPGNKATAYSSLVPGYWGAWEQG